MRDSDATVALLLGGEVELGNLGARSREPHLAQLRSSVAPDARTLLRPRGLR